MKILVTGSSGMIGNHLVNELLIHGYEVVGIDKKPSLISSQSYKHYELDLSDTTGLKKLFCDNKIDRVIHLAALAHASNSEKYKWEAYKYFNYECSKNLFDSLGNIPVLLISTVDVFGFTKGVISVYTSANPVSFYGISKLMAEKEIQKKISYDIFRFSPVYTDSLKRDIQKRYYLKYPKIAYKIGKGIEFEALSIDNAVLEVVNWCSIKPNNSIKIIKDSKNISTSDCISFEKKEGRANIVIRIPRWIAVFTLFLTKSILRMHKHAFLLHKAVYPLRTE